jgi:hypothetical protein
MLTEVSDQLVEQLIQTHGVKSTLNVLARLGGYTGTPPTMQEFINDQFYLGDLLGSGIYPYWVSALNKIYPNPFHSPYLEVILTGAIGLGKSTAALTGIVYDLVKLMHMKDPHERYKLIRSTKISVALINATLDLAGGVLYDQFMEWVSISPFLKENLSSKQSACLFKNNLTVVTGSRFSHVLGMAIVGAIMSEVNFQDKVANQALESYNAIKARLQSRFMSSSGSYPSRVFLDSSKKDSGSFIETVILKGRELDSQLVVFDAPIWDVLPEWKIKYSGEKFKVFIGSENRDPFLVTRPDQLINVDDSYIIDVPVEYKNNFVQDIHIALRDLAGKSTQATHKFITSAEKVNDSLGRENPIKQLVISLDFFNIQDRLIDYVDFTKIIPSSNPRFIHIDLGIKYDKTGIACTRLDGIVKLDTIDPITLDRRTTESLVYYTEFVMYIEPKAGQEVPIYKIKDFILDLNSRGFPIAIVTTDGFQSTNLRQDLTLRGFNAELLSVDRSTDPYSEFKMAILEGRWNGVIHPILEDELMNLQLTDKKVDHPIGKSKDGTDAICGSIWSARINYTRFMGNFNKDEMIKAIDELNAPSLYEVIASRSRPLHER